MSSFMSKLILIVSVFFSIGVNAQTSSTIAIIPQPVSIRTTTGQMVLPQNVTIAMGSQPALKGISNLLTERLTTAAGRKVKLTSASSAATINLVLNKTKDPKIGSEGYTVSVTSKNITIRANEAAGLFYGTQTLLQLLPKEIESKVAVSNVKWQVPSVEITDYPRFGWR